MTKPLSKVWTNEYDRFLTWTLRRDAAALIDSITSGLTIDEEYSALFGHWHNEVQSGR